MSIRLSVGCLGVTAAMAVGVSVSAEAQEFIMNNVTDAAPSYYAAANYAGGVAPDYATSAGYDDVVWATNAIGFAQTLTMANWNPTTDSTVFAGILHGDACRRLNNAIGYSNRYLALSDLADWPGLVYHSTGNMYLKFRPGVGETATLPYASFEKKARVGVSDKNARLDVGRAFGKGWHILNEVADTTNPGTIDIQSHFFGPRACLEMSRGDLVIAGTPTAEPTVVGDPALHLDAAAADSAFETTAGASQTFVDRWYDCRGGEGRPYAEVDNAQMKPFFATDDVTGRRVVDFGTSLVDTGDPCNMFLDGVNIGFNGYSGATLGRFGYLKFNAQLENIREVFVVLREKFHTNGDAPFLGNVKDEPQYFERRVERDNPLYSIRSLLFKDTAATDGLKLGEIRLDGAGVPLDNADDLSRSFHVLSLGLGLPAKAMYIGTNGKTVCKKGADGYERGFSLGGFKLAEMIVYTNALTSVERGEVTRYLKRKWLRGEDRDLDLGELKPADGRGVEVPSGTLRVAKLKVSTDKALVKKGAGTLEATMAPTNRFALTVQGGEVVFAASPAKDDPSDPQPAANPDNWFRADDETSMTLEDSGVEGVETVKAWRHCENGGTNTEGLVVQLRKVKGADPTRYRDPDFGNRYVVRLGDFTSSYTSGQIASYLSSYYWRAKDSTWNTADPVGKVRCGFLVVRSEEMHANLLSSMSTALFRDNYNTGNLICGYAQNVFGDYFAVDGVRIAADSKVSDNVYHLISFRLATELNMGAIGGQQSGTVNMGGVRVAERIQYKRELTDAEFRQTEAYLFKKYFGREHPDAERAKAPISLSSLGFGEDATARMTSDRDVTVGDLSVAGDSFEKAGEGAMSAPALPLAVRNVTVSGGALASSVDWLADAYFHVDASVADTVKCISDGERDNLVDRWYDVRGNGMYAACARGVYNNGKEPNFTNATYETSSDKVGPNLIAGSRFIDLGTRAGMYWYREGSSSTIKTTTLREYHMVFCLTGQGNHTPIAGVDADMTPNGYLDSMYHKQSPIAQSSPKLTDDGVWRTNNKYLDSGKSCDTNRFYVISVSLTGNVKAGSFGIDRTSCGRGYLKLCELILFNDQTNTQARCEAIHNHLMRKWLGKGEQKPLPVALDSLAVADGATLQLTSAEDAAVSTASLTGGGTLTMPALEVAPAGGEAYVLSRQFKAADALDCLTVNGALTLPAGGKVVLSSAPGVKPVPGYYPVIKATSLDVDRTGWALDASAALPNRSYKLVIKANEIGVNVEPPGLLMIVR